MTNSKHISLLPLVLTMLVLASNAMAQTATARPLEIANEPANSESITAARNQYTNNANAERITRNTDDSMQLAQFSRRAPHPSQHAHTPGYRRSPRMDYGDSGHALIGAAIGFGLGAAIGAKATTDSHPGATVGAVVLIGGLGALIGAVVGGNHGGPYPFSHHRRTPPSWGKDEDLDRSADSAGPHFGHSSAERSAEVGTGLAR
jgi:hypothetical protein